MGKRFKEREARALLMEGEVRNVHAGTVAKDGPTLVRIRQPCQGWPVTALYQTANDWKES